jgi:hypothetical protein
MQDKWMPSKDPYFPLYLNIDRFSFLLILLDFLSILAWCIIDMANKKVELKKRETNISIFYSFFSKFDRAFYFDSCV